MRVAAHSGGIGAAFNALADSLLGADPGAMEGAGAEQTRSLRALRAYALGERAMRAWDLTAATSAFRTAIVGFRVRTRVPETRAGTLVDRRFPPGGRT